MKVIALGHRRNTGKDLFADFLSKNLTDLGYKVKRESFAGVLYKVCEMMYSWDGFKTKEIYDQDRVLKEEDLPTIGKSPRTILIEVGNLIRQVYPETWIESLFGNTDDVDIMIIRDLRYPNEAEAVHKHNGLCIRMTRPGIEEFNDVADIALVDYKDWDYEIINDGSAADLELKAQNLATNLRVKEYLGHYPIKFDA